MRVLFVILLGMTFTSGIAADIQPIGSIGQPYPEQNDAFLPDGTILRVLMNRIEIVNPNTNEIIAQFAERTKMGDVTISSDGLWIAITTHRWTSASNLVEIWDIATQKRVREWETSSYLSLLTFSPTAPLLATSSRADIDLWNWDTGEHLGKMEGERRPTQVCYQRGGGQTCSGGAGNLSLAFSPDGRYLVVGSKRPDSEIWDVPTRQLVGHLEGHRDWVKVVSYSQFQNILPSVETVRCYSRVMKWG